MRPFFPRWKVVEQGETTLDVVFVGGVVLLIQNVGSTQEIGVCPIGVLRRSLASVSSNQWEVTVQVRGKTRRSGSSSTPQFEEYGVLIFSREDAEALESAIRLYESGWVPLIEGSLGPDWLCSEDGEIRLVEHGCARSCVQRYPAVRSLVGHVFLHYQPASSRLFAVCRTDWNLRLNQGGERTVFRQPWSKYCLVSGDLLARNTREAYQARVRLQAALTALEVDHRLVLGEVHRRLAPATTIELSQDSQFHQFRLYRPTPHERSVNVVLRNSVHEYEIGPSIVELLFGLLRIEANPTLEMLTLPMIGGGLVSLERSSALTLQDLFSLP